MKHDVETQDGKKILSVAEFDKEVEKEFGFLSYLDGLPEKEAMRKARQNVSEKYELVKRNDN